MHRRHFLKTLATTTATTAAAAAATAAFPQILRAQPAGRATANARLAIGVIGTGGQGLNIMGQALASKRAQVIAVCDVDTRHAATARQRVNTAYENNDCAVYRDYRELLVRPGIDAVLIATPDHWHALQTIHAARAGKHIYCEKPAATTPAESRAMINAVARAGVACQIGSMQRSWAEFQRAIALARNGCLGKILSTKVGLPPGARLPQDPDRTRPDPIPPELDYELWLGPAPHRPYFEQGTHYYWRHNFAFSGGRLTDWIGHHHDIATLALGVDNQLPVAIRNARATFIEGRSLFNTAWTYNFDAHYASGAIVNLCDENREGITIEGTEGTIHVTRGRITHSTRALERVIIPPWKNPLARGARAHMENFIACALDGGEPRCPVISSHASIGAGHLANAAFRSGRSELLWNPVTETPIDAPDTAPFLQKTYRAPWTFPA
ncbi:MAG: Gfo/Idh/MocA family oxidoreductase [Opitutaceae bacterium]|jgi:predicted dehydrogenase|nr:Gfo/Idh/MocA family oxidoreductase [Opitutaceae bacterium]